MLAHTGAAGQIPKKGEPGKMTDGGKCPLGKNAWLATFLVVAFILIFVSRKLGLL